MKNTLDFYKLENEYFNDKLGIKEKELIGAINFNNMIPLTSNNYEVIDLNKKCKSIDEEKYIRLLKLDFKCINENIKDISRKAKILYELYLCNKLDNKIYLRCCDFPLLEEKCKEYNNVTE